MEKMLGTVERLRLKEGYSGYIHLKLIPGAFSAFHPIERSPFAEQPAEDPTRALRLYQSDFMLRDYGFSYAELPFDEQGLLPRYKTPKQAWAEHNLHEPIELNRAPRHLLLRIPGIGPKSADKILAARREARLRDLSQLKALGVTTGWAAPYVLLDGRRSAVQLPLW